MTILIFFAGLFIGSTFGLLAAALCFAAAHGDEKLPDQPFDDLESMIRRGG